MPRRFEFEIPDQVLEEAERSESFVWAWVLTDPRSEKFEAAYGIVPPAQAMEILLGLKDDRLEIRVVSK